MPRGFVPCLYQERLFYDVRDGAQYVQYGVTELFEMGLRKAHRAAVVLTSDSHAFHNETSWMPQEQARWPMEIEAQRVRSRTRLFDHFYAALAALE